MKLTAAGVLAAAVLIASLAQIAPVQAQPLAVLVSPRDGQVLAEPPAIIHMCFNRPVNVRDLDKGGDFRFRVVMPDGRALGLRIVFQPDGLGVDVHPGIPPDQPAEGDWTFEWRVTDPNTLEPNSGSVKFTVGAGGSPVSDESPKSCDEETAQLDPIAGQTAVDGRGDENSDGGGGSDEGDDGGGILVPALIAAGVAAGAGALGAIAIVAYRRRGHRPPRSP